MAGKSGKGSLKGKPKKTGTTTRKVDRDLTKQRKSVEERVARARAIAKEVNKRLKGKGSVHVGADIEELEFQKEHTGNPAIDYVTNGGLIRGRITQFWGPEGCAKTTSMAAVVRDMQRRGMVCGFAPVEGFDKGWWRSVGVFIPYGDKEFDAMDKAKRKRGELYNRFYLDEGWAPLTLVQHRAGDEVLQILYDLTKSNAFDFLGLDSLGAITSSRILEDKDVSDPAEYGGEAKLFNTFQRFMQSAFNTYYDDDGNIDQNGHRLNRTMVVAINQARVAIGVRAMRREKQFYPTGGQGLKHFWSQSLFFDHLASEEQSDYVNYDGAQRRDVYAKTFRVFGHKMRGGPPDREARFTLHVKRHTHDGQSWRAGQIDTVSTVRSLGVMLGVIQRAGSYLTFDGVRHGSKASFDAALWEDQALYDKVYAAVMGEAIRQSGAHEVPDWE